MHLEKRVLVTGGAGFLGAHLCGRLLKSGASVICLDNYFTGTRRNIDGLLDHHRFKLIRHDVTFPLYAAAGKPMIYIGDTNGELARLVSQHGCGVAMAPGDSAALADLLQGWSKAPAKIAEMGTRACALLDAHYSRRQGLERWRALLDQLAEDR